MKYNGVEKKLINRRYFNCNSKFIISIGNSNAVPLDFNIEKAVN